MDQVEGMELRTLSAIGITHLAVIQGQRKATSFRGTSGTVC
jgi:hypothetical protein